MFGLLVLVGLFVALTPGILFKLKGSKMAVAAMHAVLFGVVLYVVSMYGPSYGVSLEGFQNSGVYTPAPASRAAPSAAPGLTAKSLVFCNKQLNQVFEVISVNPNRTLTVTDATYRQKGTGTMQTANCELITNYIGKEVNCNRSTGTNVIVKNVRRDAYFEVYAKKTPNNVQAIPPGTCVIVPTIVGTITSAITGKK